MSQQKPHHKHLSSQYAMCHVLTSQRPPVTYGLPLLHPLSPPTGWEGLYLQGHWSWEGKGIAPAARTGRKPVSCGVHFLGLEGVQSDLSHHTPLHSKAVDVNPIINHHSMDRRTGSCWPCCCSVGCGSAAAGTCCCCCCCAWAGSKCTLLSPPTREVRPTPAEAGLE